MLQRAGYWGIWFNLLLANFNLIPIPPLDGSHLAYHVLPSGWRQKYRELSRFGILILLGILFFFPRGLYMLLTPAIAVLKLTVTILEPVALEPFGLF